MNSHDDQALTYLYKRFNMARSMMANPALSQCQVALEEYAEATEAALKAVQLNPSRPEEWMVGGMVHYHCEEWKHGVPIAGCA